MVAHSLSIPWDGQYDSLPQVFAGQTRKSSRHSLFKYVHSILQSRRDSNLLVSYFAGDEFNSIDRVSAHGYAVGQNPRES